MSAAVVRAWDRRPIVVGWRLPAAYPVSVAVVAVAVIVAACAGSASQQRLVTLETVQYAALPEALHGMKVPIASDGIVAIAEHLPEQVAGQGRLPYGGWQNGEQFTAGWGDVSAWGARSGLAGTPPIQIVIRHVDSLGPQSAGSGGAAVIADANRTVNMTGPLELGRDGRVVWLRRASVGYSVAWGRLDSPWLYVVTASNEREFEAALLAIRHAAGTHGGRSSTMR